MKRYFLPMVLSLALAISCSSDSDDNDNDNEMTGSSSLVGTWNMSDVRFEEDPNDTSLNLADEVVDFLFEQDCILVSFTFEADGSVSSTDKLNYIIPDAGPTGLQVDCPTESDMETATWTLDGNQLTIDDGNGTTETLTIEFEGNNTLIISGDDIDANNYAGAEAVFTRQ